MDSRLKTLKITFIDRDKDGEARGVTHSRGNEASHWGEGGEPCDISHSQGSRAIHVMDSVNIARHMLLWPHAKQSFSKLGREFLDKVRKAKPKFDVWWGSKSMDDLVKDFIDTILTHWPPIIIDFSFEHLDNNAATFRNRYEGNFVIRDNVIAINGLRVDLLCEAGARSMNSNQNSKAKQVYRIYACSLALTIIHELGHLFVTYLSHGKVDTPNEMKTPRGHDMPEAGFFLEIVMFGGRVGISRHAKDHADTYGDLYIHDEEGKVVMVTQKAVNDMYAKRFQFPLDHIEVDPTDLQTLGADTPYVDDVTEPLESAMIKWFLDLGENFGDEANTFRWKKLAAELEGDEEALLETLPWISST